MKYLALIVALVATPALAQDAYIEQLDAAKRAHIEKSAADAISGAENDQVSGINIRVDLKATGEPGRPGQAGVQSDVVISPGDPEFDAVLGAAKAAFARKSAKADEEMQSSGITITAKPTVPAVEE